MSLLSRYLFFLSNTYFLNIRASNPLKYENLHSLQNLSKMYLKTN